MRFKGLGLAGVLALAAGCASGGASPIEDADQDRTAEAAQLTMSTDVRRRGRDLILDRTGRPPLVLRDSGICEGFGTCERWTYLGTVDFGQTRRRLVEMAHGEGEEVHAFDERGGELVFATPPAPSPDGRFAVTSGPDDMEEYPSLSIRSADNEPALLHMGFLTVAVSSSPGRAPGGIQVRWL
jgi:hypothetical protein